MSRKNENVSNVEEQEIGEFEQPINEGITFNRPIEFTTASRNEQSETGRKEIEGNDRRQHSIHATFVNKLS